MLNDPETGYSALKELASRDLTTAKGILNSIKATFERIKNKLTHNEGRYYGKYLNLTQQEQAIKLFEKAVRDGAKNRYSDVQNSSNGVSYSIETIPGTNMQYVQADRQVITGDNKNQWGKNLENYINEVIRQGNDLVIPTTDGDLLKITEDTAWKIGDPHTISSVKSNAGTHIDELAKVSKYITSSDLKKDRTKLKFKADDFEYRNAFFRDYDGKYYTLNISIGVDSNGKTVYSIGSINERQFPSFNGSSSNGGALMDGELSQPDNTTTNGKSQEVFAYKDAEMPNNPFSDAFGNIGIDSLFNNDDKNSSSNTQNDFTDYNQYKSGVESAKKAVDDAVDGNKRSSESITIGVVSEAENKVINRLKNDDRHRGNFKGVERTVSERYIAHAYNEHSNPIKEALRGQLALTKEDIKTAIEKLSRGESRIVQDTYTTKGQPSVLSEIQINGYSYYAEEILKDSFDLRTIYKAPTPTQANVPGTMRPGTVPRNRNVSASKISIAQNTKKSTGNFVVDEIIKIAENKTWNENLLDKDGNVKKHGGLDCSGGFNYYDTKFAVDNSGYLHEIIKIGELSDTAVENNQTNVMNNTPVIGVPSDTAVAESNAIRVNDSTPIDSSITNPTEIV